MYTWTCMNSLPPALHVLQNKFFKTIELI